MTDPDRTLVVPNGGIEVEHEVRRSRFIARAEGVASRPAALAVVDAARARAPDARHHCFAYQLGGGGQASAGMSDDGEPSGTAGKPILNGIQHKGIGNVIVVVTRYFGGVKLGAGGLARAYGAATEQALARLPTRIHEARARRVLYMGFADEQPFRHWAGQHDGSLEDVHYGDGVTISVTFPERHVQALEAFCASHGVAVDRDA